jgi:hypothetical protein
MDSVNAAARRLFALLWTPFDGLPLWIGLVVVSALFGVVALVAMKYTTNPKRVTRFKDRYQGHIFAIKLFRDSFTIVVSSLVKTLGWVGCYLGEQLKPAVLLLVPAMLLFAQMQMRLGFAPLKLGQSVLLSVDLGANAPTDLKVAFDPPAGLELAAKPVREPSRHRVVVPLVARSAGAYVVKLTCGGETVEKTVHAGSLAGAPMVSPTRSNSWWDRVLDPAEASFGAGSLFQKVELAYPVRALPFLGLDLSFGKEWGMMIDFLVLTIVVAFALKGVFGVTI